MTGFTPRLDEAFAYARHLHRDQVRKGSGVPYLGHLMTVAALVIEAGGTETQVVAALLHDAVEDQGGLPVLEEIRTRFGDGVAAIVSDCTDAWIEPKPPWRARKEAYLAALPFKPRRSLLVSLCDKVANVEAIETDRREIGDDVWDRFTGQREGTIWYYASLAAIFDEVMPGALADRLMRAVAGFGA